jgi:hypothetical protein
LAVAYAAGDHFAIEIVNLDTPGAFASANDRVVPDSIQWDAAGDRVFFLRADDHHGPAHMGTPVVPEFSALEVPRNPRTGVIGVRSSSPLTFAERSVTGSRVEHPIQ